MNHPRMFRGIPLTLVALLATMLASPGFAQTAKASAIGRVTASVAKDIGADAKDTVVFASPLKSDEGAPRGADLVAQLEALVAGAIGPGATVRPEPVGPDRAQTLGRKAKVIVYLKIEIARGELRLSADLYRPGRTVWDRARQPSLAPISHAFASARIDAEVRSYLAPVPLLAKRIDRASAEERDVLAIACGDVDSDGAIELVVVSRRRVAAGRVRGGLFTPISTASLADLSPIAPAPLREPLAGAVILEGGPLRPGLIDIGITDRAHGSRLDERLKPIAPIGGVPFATPGGDACLGLSGTTLAPIVKPCAEGDGTFDPFDVGSGVDAIARASISGRDGKPNVVEARHDPVTRELTLRMGTSTFAVPRSGAQIAIADLDGDGDPEVISTLDVLAFPAGSGVIEDAVEIRSLRAGGRLEQRARVPVASGVRAVAACPPDAPGPASIVIATAGELWIVR
jgi:hypothetical protein